MQYRFQGGENVRIRNLQEVRLLGHTPFQAKCLRLQLFILPTNNQVVSKEVLFNREDSYPHKGSQS